MKKYKIILVVLLSVFATGAFAQNTNDMRLNEVMVGNTNSIVDDYGERESWIELFNSSYGTVNIGGCFLSNDPDSLTLYQIPKGDLKTGVQPRQSVVFYADGNSHKGTFYLNFTIKEGDEIFFVLGDGRTIVDRIKIPVQLDTNCSYERKADGVGSVDGNAEYWTTQTMPSPNTTVYVERFETKSEKMKRLDPYGWIMSLTAMSVVFVCLIVLYLCFKFVGNMSKKKMRRSATTTPAGKASVEKQEDLSSETCAAIAVALELYNKENEIHDSESFMVTMQHTDRSYSPWSAKIYTLRQTPELTKNKR